MNNKQIRMNMNEISKKIEGDMDELGTYLENIKNVENYKDFPEFRDNPFRCLLNSVMKMNWKTKGSVNDIASIEYTDRETGEVVEATMNKIFRRKEYVDKERFTKLYYGQMKEMFALSHTALKVFGYILNELHSHVGNDSIYFRLQECMDFCGYSSRSMVYTGLTELIVKGFICKTDKTWQFFINPLYAFNGNRIVVFNEYIQTDYFEDKKELGK